MARTKGTKRQPKTPEQFTAERKAHEEFLRLAKRYWKLRETMKPEAILLAWFMYGDAAWENLQ